LVDSETSKARGEGCGGKWRGNCGCIPAILEARWAPVPVWTGVQNLAPI